MKTIINYWTANKKLQIIFGIVYLAIFSFIIVKGPNVTIDSASYIEMDVIRLPLYPFFLKLFSSISPNSFLVIVCIVQTILGIAAVLIFIIKLKQIFVIHEIAAFILSIILLLPYLLFFKTGNYILSEALSYPLYLLFCAYFIYGFTSNSTKSIACSILLTLLLLLTRSQFLFIVPVAVISLIYLFIREKKRNRILIFILLYCLTPFLAILIDMTYHATKHNHFVTTPWTGMHLLASGIFVADFQDIEIFKDPEEHELFEKIYLRLEKEGLTLNQFKKTHNEKGYRFYSYNFIQIDNVIIHEEGMRQFSNDNYIINSSC